MAALFLKTGIRLQKPLTKCLKTSQSDSWRKPACYNTKPWPVISNRCVNLVTKKTITTNIDSFGKKMKIKPMVFFLSIFRSIHKHLVRLSNHSCLYRTDDFLWLLHEVCRLFGWLVGWWGLAFVKKNGWPQKKKHDKVLSCICHFLGK